MKLSPVDPVALRIGPLELRWYGLMYLCAFATGYVLARFRVAKAAQSASPHAPAFGWTRDNVDDMVTIFMLGAIVGGRLGYVLFYDLPTYFADPVEIFRIWNGGMSFHGGLLGVLAGFWYFARKTGRSFLQVADFVAPFVPPGLFFGRIGNFINGELWGSVTSAPWGVVFAQGGPLARHPSQLYEAALEGLALFIIVWIYSAKRRARGAVAGMFALGYGVFRFAVEFVRMPDAHLGYLAGGWLTMGQLLCLPLIGIGLWLLCRKGDTQQKQAKKRH